MANGTIKPWHQVVKLREDVKTGELTLAMFAADLYDVKMGTAKSVSWKRRPASRTPTL